MKSKILIAIIGFFTISLVFAENLDTKKCDGSTPEIYECINAKIKKADSKLNQTYSEILKSIVDKKKKKLLKVSQKSWLDHMNKEINFIDAYFAGGSYRGIRVGYAKLEFLEKRTLALEDLIRP